MNRLALALLAVLPLAAGAQQPEPTVLRSEQELKVSIETPALASTQCQATTTAAYEQRNTNARVRGTIKVESCKAASGEYTVTIIAVSKPSCFSPNGSMRESEEVMVDVVVTK